MIEHGTPLVDDLDWVGAVRQLGIDETSFLAATADHATVYATCLVDLERHIVIDMVEGNSAADLRPWTEGADPRWLAWIEGGGHRPGRAVPRRALTGPGARPLTLLHRSPSGRRRDASRGRTASIGIAHRA